MALKYLPCPHQQVIQGPHLPKIRMCHVQVCLLQMGSDVLSCAGVHGGQLSSCGSTSTTEQYILAPMHNKTIGHIQKSYQCNLIGLIESIEGAVELSLPCSDSLRLAPFDPCHLRH